MKDQIHTAPVYEAFDAGDECPFCYLERQAEQHALRFTAGPSASYMAPDIRAETNRLGFCPGHMKKLYDYGNALGNALMLQTYFESVLEEMSRELAVEGKPVKKSMFSRKKADAGDSYGKRLEARVQSCFVCEKIDYNMGRYWNTFFWLLKEAEFRQKVEHSKGFCLRHFAKMLDMAEEKVPSAQKAWFSSTVIPLTQKHLDRVKEDLDWLVAKYDYRNADADWRNSKDALQRSMQKLAGIYPADPPYKNE